MLLFHSRCDVCGVSSLSWSWRFHTTLSLRVLISGCWTVHDSQSISCFEGHACGYWLRTPDSICSPCVCEFVPAWVELMMSISPDEQISHCFTFTLCLYLFQVVVVCVQPNCKWIVCLFDDQSSILKCIAVIFSHINVRMIHLCSQATRLRGWLVNGSSWWSMTDSRCNWLK
jgi:hypothetical protein